MANLLASILLLVVPALVLHRSIARELVDLSYVYNSSMVGAPTERPFQMFITQNLSLGNEIKLKTEEIVTATHYGTHIDAPCHGAVDRWTLDQIPLTHLVAPAAVVDITERAATNPDAEVRVSDLEHWEQQWGRTLDGTILLVRTGWNSRWPDREAYLGTSNADFSGMHFPGMSPETADWLVQNRKVYGVGIDTLAIDMGVNMKEFPVHLILMGANMYILEVMTNLQKLPGYGAQLYALPMKLGDGACGGPTRVLADLP